jgi:hypothetical protein
MLSWRGAADGGTGVGGFFMVFLPDDVRIARKASSETAPDQKLMQIGQRRHGDARHSDLHAGADHRVEHPGRHARDHAGGRLDVGDLTGGMPLTGLKPDTAPVLRVPTIMDEDFLPDMGRITPRWQPEGATASLPAATLRRHTAHLAISL